MKLTETVKQITLLNVIVFIGALTGTLFYLGNKYAKNEK